MRSTSALGPVMDSPSTRISPDVTSSRRLRQRRKVDLPEPEGPIIHTTSPGWISMSMPRSTWFSPKSFLRPVTLIFGSAIYLRILFSSWEERIMSTLVITRKITATQV